MKQIFCIVLLFNSLASFSQKKYYVDNYKHPSGWAIGPGTEIKFGIGTLPNKAFAFVYTSPWSLAGRISMSASAAGHSMKVKEVVFYKSKQDSGYYIMFQPRFATTYWAEFESAIKTGEIVIPEQYATVKENKGSGSSLADELKKLKDLFDSGAITKEEYDASKKKAIGQ